MKMKTKHTPAFAALRRGRQNPIAAALLCALTATTALAQTDSGVYRPLTLAPADATSSGGGGAGDDAKATAAELAKQLNNPVASLISVPIQNNWDFGIGPANAMKYTANIQPVIPFSISEDWIVITRTELAVRPTGPGHQRSAGRWMPSFFMRE
jgi:hypothetical protein